MKTFNCVKQMINLDRINSVEYQLLKPFNCVPKFNLIIGIT